MREAGLTPDADPAHLNWKYWRERVDWPGSRSFVLTDGRDLLAHVAVVPVNLLSDAGRTRLASMVDWAARPRAVGAGVRVMKHVATLTDALLAIGGNPAARRVMALMGFEQRGLVTGYVRPLSPVSLLRERSIPLSKRVPRFARSFYWTMKLPRLETGAWQVRRLSSEEVARLAPVLSNSPGGRAMAERSVAQLRYMLDCVTVPVRLYGLEREGRTLGYFVLTITPGQARLVDARMVSEASADWAAMLRCASREAKREGVLELTTWSSDPILSRTLQESGFHPRFTIPILVAAGNGSLPIRVPLHVQMLDSDLAYLYDEPITLWA